MKDKQKHQVKSEMKSYLMRTLGQAHKVQSRSEINRQLWPKGALHTNTIWSVLYTNVNGSVLSSSMQNINALTTT